MTSNCECEKKNCKCEDEIEQFAIRSKISLKLSMLIHIIIGVIAIICIFLVQAKVNYLIIKPQMFIAPSFVGVVLGYVIWRNKERIIEQNINLDNIVKKRTKELSNKVDMIASKDIELLDMNDKLINANNRLKILDAKKDEFISLAAHELKTPLTSIHGFAQLLKDEKIKKDKKMVNHYIDLIINNTDTLYHFVLDLVDSSRISIGKLRLVLKEIKINDIYHEIRQNTELIIKDKGLKPIYDIEKNLPNILADYDRILQVLRNLITNSVNYTNKGSIKLKIFKKDKNFIQFEVIDTGQGIPKENQNLIFSRFYQVDSSMTRKIGGSGLGLSICKGIIKAHKGIIDFKSEKNKGTTFYFTVQIYKK